MTRHQQQQSDPRYKDWRAAYREDVLERVKHWGVSRGSSIACSKPRLHRYNETKSDTLTSVAV